MRFNVYKNITSLLLLALLFAQCSGKENPGDEYFKMKKKEMIEEQIKARGVKDEKVLNAMAKVDRHNFVPLENRKLSYEDYPLPIGEDQTISQPYIVALMTELCGLKGREKVLEVGTGSGYQAAVLAEIAKEVYSVEIIESLAKKAEETLKQSGYKNIKIKSGDGYAGWKEHAPFDCIIVTCASPVVPKPLIEQLKEGGRLVIPVGDSYQELKRITKEKGKIKEESIIPVRFVPMTGDGIKKGE